MSIKLVCDWRALFSYAGDAGKARIKYRDNPTEENRLEMERAVAAHESYRDMCLEAAEMIGLDSRGI